MKYANMRVQAALLMGTLGGSVCAADEGTMVRAGRLCDHWSREAKTRAPSETHPLLAGKSTVLAESVTWRCVTCRGWDYRGNEGAYAKGRHATGIKGLRGMAGGDTRRIADVLRDTNHGYDKVLKHRDLQDLAHFVSLGQIDMDPLIDRQTRMIKADPLKGGPVYRTVCAGCHENDGHHLGSPPLGSTIRANPWGALHAVLNGHPSEKMPALREIDRRILLDVLAHAQELPDKN